MSRLRVTLPTFAPWLSRRSVTTSGKCAFASIHRTVGPCRVPVPCQRAHFARSIGQVLIDKPAIIPLTSFQWVERPFATVCLSVKTKGVAGNLDRPRSGKPSVHPWLCLRFQAFGHSPIDLNRSSALSYVVHCESSSAICFSFFANSAWPSDVPPNDIS